jgi:hypothetical protein
MACRAEGRDGTSLPGCVKTYIPAGRPLRCRVRRGDPSGSPIGPSRHRFGVRHHPRGSNAVTSTRSPIDGLPVFVLVLLRGLLVVGFLYVREGGKRKQSGKPLVERLSCRVCRQKASILRRS